MATVSMETKRGNVSVLLDTTICLRLSGDEMRMFTRPSPFYSANHIVRPTEDGAAAGIVKAVLMAPLQENGAVEARVETELQTGTTRVDTGTSTTNTAVTSMVTVVTMTAMTQVAKVKRHLV